MLVSGAQTMCLGTFFRKHEKMKWREKDETVLTGKEHC